MVLNDVEAELLEDTPNKIKKFGYRTLLSHALSINALSASLLCMNIPSFNDFVYRHKESLISFDDFDISDERISNTEAIRIGMYYGLKTYTGDLNILAGTINKVFNASFISRDLSDGEKDIAIDSFYDMNKIIDRISEAVYGSLGAISDEVFYVSYGRKPRNTYKVVIDLVLAYEDGVDVYIFTPGVNGGMYNATSITNVRLLAIMNHFEEIGIKVRQYYEIIIPILNDGTKKFEYRINKVGHTEFTVRYAKRFFDLDFIQNANLVYCRQCTYNKQCKPANMIPIIPIR